MLDAGLELVAKSGLILQFRGFESTSRSHELALLEVKFAHIRDLKGEELVRAGHVPTCGYCGSVAEPRDSGVRAVGQHDLDSCVQLMLVRA
jgi:hypothetical protein